MGKITQSVSLSEITSIITKQMALMEVNHSTQISNTNTSVQVIDGSTNCRNRKITFNKSQYMSSSSVFQSMNAVQTLNATVTNQIVSKLATDQTGGTILPTTSTQELTATIKNLIATTLTQQSILDYFDTIQSSNTSIQICRGSQGGGNYIFGSYNEVYDFYQQSYTQMTQVQKVAADVSNTIDVDLEAKQTGLVAMLTKMITVICIVLIIVAAIVVVIVLSGMVI